MVGQMFWPFAIKAAAERMNSLHIDTDGHTPESKFYGVTLKIYQRKPSTQCSVHAMFCTVDFTTRVQLDHQSGN
jgi:hypothetical protein